MKVKWIFFCIGCLGLAAHNLFSGSILSSRGIGLPYDNPNIRSMGLGGTSLAIPSTSRIDATNPAGLSYIETTTLSIQSVFHTNQYKDSESSASSNYMNFDGFYFAIPFGKGLFASFGIRPVTRIDYKIAFTEEIDSEPYTRSLQGSGGLNRFSFAAAWKPIDRVSIGMRASYLLGRLVEDSRNIFGQDGTGSDFTTSHDQVSTYADGINWTVGLQIRPFKSLIIGGLYSPKVTLDTQVDLYQIFTSASLAEGTIQYPGTFGFGASYILFNKILIAADFQQTAWSDLKINSTTIPRAQDVNRISIGIEKMASTNAYAGYFRKIPLRLGASIQPYYILDPAGNNISEIWGTFGFGLPLLHNTSSIDVMFGMGKRGSLEQIGLEENLFRFGLAITGGEKWFVRKY